MEASVKPVDSPTRSLNGSAIDATLKVVDVPVVPKEILEKTKKRRKKKIVPSPEENWTEVIGGLVLPDLRMDSVNGDMRPMEEKMKEADLMLHRRMMNLRHNVPDIVLRGVIDRSNDGHDRRYLYLDEDKDNKDDLSDDDHAGSPTFNIEERNKRRAKRLKRYPKLTYPLSDLDAYSNDGRHHPNRSKKKSWDHNQLSYSDGDLETGMTDLRGMVYVVMMFVMVWSMW